MQIFIKKPIGLNKTVLLTKLYITIDTNYCSFSILLNFIMYQVRNMTVVSLLILPFGTKIFRLEFSLEFSYYYTILIMKQAIKSIKQNICIDKIIK